MVLATTTTELMRGDLLGPVEHHPLRRRLVAAVGGRGRVAGDAALADDGADLVEADLAKVGVAVRPGHERERDHAEGRSWQQPGVLDAAAAKVEPVPHAAADQRQRSQ